MALEVTRLEAFNDNYIWLLRDAASGAVAVVDPGEAAPVSAALKARGWLLSQILLTHHHGDHIGGVAALRGENPAVQVVGPASDAARFGRLDQAVRQGDTIGVGTESAQVIEVPGHTSSHLAYYFAHSAALFCGDTLFSLGCGRMFEGTPAQFWDSLNKLRALPNPTQVYCAHEYTNANADFALSVDPDNAELLRRADEITQLRQNGQATVPSRLGDEKRLNPFLRADDPALVAALSLDASDPVSAFAALRRRKDEF